MKDNIRNIESISITDLTLNSTNKLLVVPLLMIVYDGRKTLSLCSKDKYFDIFVKYLILL